MAKETPKPAHLVAEFWAAPAEALFSQRTVAAVLDLSEAWCERQRWAGGGPAFIKIARAARYRKSDVVGWIEQRRVTSTSAAGVSA